jgi:hypothetical protein
MFVPRQLGQHVFELPVGRISQNVGHRGSHDLKGLAARIAFGHEIAETADQTDLPGARRQFVNLPGELAYDLCPFGIGQTAQFAYLGGNGVLMIGQGGRACANSKAAPVNRAVLVTKYGQFIGSE